MSINTKSMKTSLSLAAAMGTLALAVSAQAATVFTHFGLFDVTAGLDPTTDAQSIFNDTSTTGTLTYDISESGFGGTATTLTIDFTTAGGNLTNGGGNGAAVFGGNNDQWFDALDGVLTFSVTLLDAGSGDVTTGYTVDLTGIDMRWKSTGTMTIAGQNIVSGTDDSAVFESLSLVTGQTSETSFTAEATGAGPSQISGLQFDIVTVPEPTTAALLGLGGIALILRRRK